MHGGPISVAEKGIELAKREVSMGKKLAILLIPAVALTVTLAGGFASAAVQAAVSQKGNENRKTVGDGVFTAVQAERGRDACAVHCVACDADGLLGMGGPALKGQGLV